MPQRGLEFPRQVPDSVLKDTAFDYFWFIKWLAEDTFVDYRQLFWVLCYFSAIFRVSPMSLETPFALESAPMGSGIPQTSS